VFLGSLATALAVREVRAGQGSLGAFGSAELKCAADVIPTPPVPRDASYKPGAPVRTRLVADESGVPLELSGTVAGISCGPIAGAEIEFWQADGRGTYDMRGLALRGRQRTDERGRYVLSTIVPGALPGRAPCLGVHVTVSGRAELWTALFFAGRPENARDPRVRDALLVTLTGTTAKRSGSFDLRLDI
jgi:protocatechuate 3,4-dioxygenase beta subunit